MRESERGWRRIDGRLAGVVYLDSVSRTQTT